MRALLLAALVLLPVSARAWNDVDPATEFSAYTLHDNQWRLGPFRAEYGLSENWQLGTLTLLWLARSEQLKGIPNLNVKWAFWRGEDWTFSTGLGLAGATVEKDDSELKFTLIPFTLTSTWDLDPVRLHLGLWYTQVILEGANSSAGESEDNDVEGVAGVSTGQLVPVVEWLLSRTFALVFEGHIMLFQNGQADANDVYQVDDRTTVEVFGGGEADLGEGFQASVVASAMWSWETFHLRLGLGYGNYNVPGINIFIPTRTPIPELDLYWRF